APPPPPAWRNWIWPIMIVVIFALFYLLPHGTPSTSLTYSQFLSDVNAGQVKTVQLASTPGGTTTGTLTNGKSFTVVIPPQAGQDLLTTLQNEKVQVSAAPSGQGFGTEVLIYVITFGLPILLFVWFFRRLSKGAAGGIQGALGVGRSRAKVFDEERPSTTFAAIGQRRAGSGAVVSNDEREQTLNQLLAEMDGFEPAAGVVVLAATNRPEILDPALLRPGRFDRQVTIPLPNVTERAAILAVHARSKKLAPDVDLNAVARGTPGFSGADLANLTNEAAIF